ncbi:serine hydrolase domain-containing protein [Variovorax ginsengisoli]|uniref:Methyl acetate hydrolase n=1 Tax=Variovorax ginsengisoli TaxID=363844 RepID=A0ABT9S619_9BURK|nr:serine hydrolase domain-containing protein [Variovorax ginsengisoli]MDP9899191.1 methyl acetate hydrolase [Variovorax ginsengisoli]
MSTKLKTMADGILQRTVNAAGGAPGVVAMATDRKGNIYEGAAGVRELGKDQPMTADSVMAIFSTTKALTGTAIMQLVEEGKIRLDDAAKTYVPEIAEIQVLDGFDAAGQPKTRAPRRDITLRDLMLHTAGFSYEFFSHDDLKLRTARNIPTVVSSTFESIRTVLVHEPGERWTYGVNIDWLGKVVEQQRGKRLGEVMKERIFAPLGMVDIGFEMSDAMRARRATLHDRAKDGKLTPMPDLVLPQPPSMDMGGHGLYATVGEYMKLIRMFLNDGVGEYGRVLRPETVAVMSKNGLPEGMTSGGWTTSIASLSNDGEFSPTVRKSWAYTFQVNEEDTPTGRPAGSLMWAGLANLFYWIDRKTGVGGYWGSQILPFHDVSSYAGFVEFESAVYRSLRA